jgi:hypothetical protein
MNSIILNYEKLDEEKASNIELFYSFFILIFLLFSIIRALLILLANAVINNGLGPVVINTLINDDLGTAVINRLMGNRNNNEEMERPTHIMILTSNHLDLMLERNTRQRPN